ncbi:MAG TPA: putative lipid II flippase FtsW [Steroidobacteraceae bacterium]|nr:putative lipid II flippase FtsW [Steroidobacteraceae bacterium]
MNASAPVMQARNATRSPLARFDTVMLAVLSCILLLGLVMVTSASITIAGHEGNGDPFAYLERQLVLTCFGVLLGALAFSVPIDKLERLALPLLYTSLLLLLLVLVPGLGHKVNGSRRWLRLAGLNFQVSEAVRVLVMIYIAAYAVKYEQALRQSLGGLVRPLGLLCLVGALLLAEPDFGAAAVLMVAGFGVLFLAGAQLRWVLAAVGLLGGAMTLLVVFSRYRMQRLLTFLDPWADPFNSGFQLTQSLIAVGRGEWFGVGLGASVQKLFYLPEAHNDFLFAVLAEELGLVGVVVTLGLFLALAWRVLLTARRAFDAGMKFHAYLAAGFGLWVGVQAFINIAINMGALPTKGLTLPFMSYGRSSMLVTLAWVGVILRVQYELSAGRNAVTRERVR